MAGRAELDEALAALRAAQQAPAGAPASAPAAQPAAAPYVPQAGPAGMPQEWLPIIDRAAAERGIPVELARQLFTREAGWTADASPAGAIGPAQVMPDTARQPGYGLPPLGDPRDPAQAIPWGLDYLAAMHREMGGDWAAALAAYNAGPGTVRQAQATGAALPGETRAYVQALAPFAEGGGAAPGGSAAPRASYSREELDGALRLLGGPSAAASAAPEPKEGGEAPWWRQTGAATMATPEQQITFYAARRFPNLPLSEAIQRYGLKDGAIFYEGLDGQRYYEEGGGFASRAPAEIVRQAPAALGGLAGFMLGGGPVSPLTGAAGGALGAMAGESARQAVGTSLAGEAPPWQTALQKIGMEGLFDVGATGVGNLIVRGVKSQPFRELEAKIRSGVVTSAEALMKTARDDFGIDLTWAEASNLRSLLGRQQYVMRTGEAGDLMQERYLARQGRIRSAVDDLLGKVSPQGSGVAASGQMTDAAREFIDRQFAGLTARTSPLYKLAYQSTPALPTAGVRAIIDRELPNAVGGYQSLLKSYRQELANPSIGTERLHNLRRAIDDQIEKVKTGALVEVDRGAARNLTVLRDAIDAELKSIPAFAKADAEHSAGVKAIQAETGGLLSTIADKRKESATLARELFSGAEADQTTVRQVRNQILAVAPEAWDAVTRSYLQQALDAAAATGRIGRVSDVGGKFVGRVWGDGNTKEAAMIRLALEHKPDVLKSFETLMEVLSATSRALAEGSPTQRYMLTERAMRDEALAATPGLAAGTSVLQGLSLDALPRLGSAIQNIAAGRYNERLARALWEPEMQQALAAIQAAGPGTQAGVQLLTRVLGAITDGTVVDPVMKPRSTVEPSLRTTTGPVPQPSR